MKKSISYIVFIFLTIAIIFGTTQNVQKKNVTDTLKPPVAKKIQVTQKIYDYEFVDDYLWLIDETRSDSAVIEYIEAENTYADYILSDMQALKDTIFNEIISRIGEEYENAPTRWGDYYYYSKREEGKPY